MLGAGHEGAAGGPEVAGAGVGRAVVERVRGGDTAAPPPVSTGGPEHHRIKQTLLNYRVSKKKLD